MAIVMPIGGHGKRFKDAGYTFPKPLVTIRNKPMLQWAVESLNMPWAHHIFVCHQDDVAQYPIREMCAQLTPKQELVIEERRQGAAAAVLYGLQHSRMRLPDHESLLIANSDQWLDWDAQHFIHCALQPEVDGMIPVFRSVHPKWSYAKVDAQARVTEVAEKRPISPWATCGLYYWKSAQRYLACTQEMIRQDKRVNGEFYVAPVYNELIAQGGIVRVYDKLTMYGMGTPEDLEEFKIAVCVGRIP